MKRQLVYVANLPLRDDSIIWQYDMTRVQRTQRWLPGELTLNARQSFQYSKGNLLHAFHSKPPQTDVLIQLITAPNRHADAQRHPTNIIGSIFNPVGQMA